MGGPRVIARYVPIDDGEIAIELLSDGSYRVAEPASKAKRIGVLDAAVAARGKQVTKANVVGQDDPPEPDKGGPPKTRIFQSTQLPNAHYPNHSGAAQPDGRRIPSKDVFEALLDRAERKGKR